MKLCRKCGESKDESLFSKKSRNADGLQGKCKACHTAYLKRHYVRYRSYYISKARVNRKLQIVENRKLILEYLESHPCVDCAEPDPMVLEFDHVRGTKLDSVSRMVSTRGSSFKAILAEIAKCEVRCANCHRRKTIRTLGWNGGLEANAI